MHDRYCYDRVNVLSQSECLICFCKSAKHNFQISIEVSDVLSCRFCLFDSGYLVKCKSPCNFGLSVEIRSYGNVDNNTVAGVISNGLLYIPINAMFNTYIQFCIITHNSKSRSQNLEQLRAQRSKSKPKTQLPELVYVG